MIRFIQDYTTKSLPPEVFEKDQEVSRSSASELYFVQLGVAGYLHDGQLVDQDYRPIVQRTIEVEVVTTDRRFAGGRGGEMLGLEAPQRASTGPRAAVATDLFATDPDLTRVQVEQLTSDLATSVQQLDDHRDSTSRQIEELTAELNAAQGARETALADLASANTDKASLTTERDAARAAVEKLTTELTDANREGDDLARRNETLTARVSEMEVALRPAISSEDGSKPGKAK